jgi:PKD repeat protein
MNPHSSLEALRPLLSNYLPRLLFAASLMGMLGEPVLAQLVPPIVIPITKERVPYYNLSEDGSRISCGVRLYGSFPVYKGRTNISDYRIFIPGVQNPGAWRLHDDNRFRFFAYFNGSDSPASSNPECNHTIGGNLPEWHAEYQPKPPKASFTSTASGSEPGVWEFLSTATDPEDQPLIEDWAFGDGSGGSGHKISHRYTKPGSFAVSLTATDTDGLTNRATRIITVQAPTPVVSVRLFNKHSGNRIELDETFRVRVTVHATVDGVGKLSDLAFSGPALSIPDIFTIVSAPTETPIGTLTPGEPPREFNWTLTATKAGRFALTAPSVGGKDDSGRSVFGSGDTEQGEVTSLIVGIEQRPARLQLGADNNNDGKTNDLDLRLELVVGITNVSKQEVTEVTAVVVNDHPIRLTSLAQDLNIWITPTGVPAGDFGTIAPGVANAVLRTNVYVATDRSYAEASILLQGKVGDAGVQARGEGLVNVGGETLLEARFDIEDRPYKAGQVVRVFGSLKNVSRFVSRQGQVLDEGKTIGVVVYPSTDGNGTGGYLVKKDFSGRTPDSPTEFMLAPDEEVEVSAILPTAEVAEATTLAVNYAVHAYIHGEDPKPRRADPTTINVVEQEGWSARHTISLAGVPEIHDPWLVCPTDLSFGGFVSCRFTEGLGNLGGSLADVGMLTASGLRELAVARWRLFGWRAWATREAIKALLGDEAARARLETELLLDLQALQAVGVESLQGIQLAAGSIGPAIERNLMFTLETVTSGDLKAIAGGMARITGENIDMPLEALVAARSARKALLMSEAAESAAKAALKASIKKKSDNLAAAVDDFASRGNIEDLPTSDVLPTGIDALPHPRIWRDGYGALRREVDAFLKIAEEEGVLMAFRSRSPAAAALIDAGKALLKPHGVSIKTVGELDVRFLGYPKKYEGLCALVSPPIPWTPRGFDRDLAVEKYLDRIPELNGPGPDSIDLRAQVRERLHFQMDEWPKQVKNFRKYKNDGVNVDFYGEKNGLGFDDIPNENRNRAAKLTREELPPAFEGEPPRYGYLLEMEDAYQSGRFLPIGGDIDFLGMFKLDGSLPDLPTRIRIYQKMRAAGMQHGESFTFYLKDLRDKFLRCCSPPPFGENEKMLTATPNGQLLTTQFKDELSVIEGGANAALKVGEGEFAYLEGVISEISSAARPGTPVLPTSAVITYQGPPIVAVATVAKMVDDLDAVVDRRDGRLVRVGPDGQPEIYVPASGQTPAVQPQGLPMSVGTPALQGVRPALQDLEVDAALEADLASLIAAGYVNTREMTPLGGQGGQWWPVSADEIRSENPGARFKIAPYTYITQDLRAGSTVLPVVSPKQLGVTNGSLFFAVGDRIVLDPGGVDEEVATIASVFPLTLSRPLTTPKLLGTMVLFLDGVDDAGALGDELPARQNLLVWLRADAGLSLTNGTNVISWTDQSPNQFVFRAPSVATQPTWVADSTSGVPAIRFNSSSTPRLQGNLGRTLTNATIFTVARYLNNSSGDRYIYAFGTINYSGLMMTLAREGGDDIFHYDGAAQRNGQNAVPGTGLRVFSQVYGENGPDRHRLMVDGRTVIESRTTVGRAYSAVATNVVLGKYVNATAGFTGDLVEWIVYDRVLTLQERLEVETYLRQRAGLSPVVIPGSIDLAGSEVIQYDSSSDTNTAWVLDQANRHLRQTGVGDPAIALSDVDNSDHIIHTKLNASAGSGAIGIVFGYQGRGQFHLLDWRQMSASRFDWGTAPHGMRLRSFHLPEGEDPTGADFWSGVDPARVTTWRTNSLPWVAGREYDVVLRLGAEQTVIEVRFGRTTLVSWVLPELKGVSGRFGHYADASPEARFGPVLLPGADPVITDLEPNADGTWTVRWKNGLPPYIIESLDDLTNGSWYPVAPATVNYSYAFPSSEQTAVFRIRSAGVVAESESSELSQTFGNGGNLWLIKATGTTRIEAEDFDEGGEGVGYDDTTSQNSLGAYRFENVDIVATTDLGDVHAVGNVASGEWLHYTVRVEAAGTYRLRARTSRGSSGSRTARFHFAGEDKTGSLVIPATGNWAIYATVESGPFELAAGEQVLRADLGSGGFNLNWIEIVRVEPRARAAFGNDGKPWLISVSGPTRIEAENFDVAGEGVAYHETTLQNNGGLYREDAVDIYATVDEDGGHGVSWIVAGEWLEYTIQVDFPGEYRLRARTARGASGNRTIRFLVDGQDKTGNLVVPRTANWNTYATVESGTFELPAGTHILRADMTSADFNLNWIEIVPVEPAP